MVSERNTLPVNGFRKKYLTSEWVEKGRPILVNGLRMGDLTSKWFEKGRPYQ